MVQPKQPPRELPRPRPLLAVFGELTLVEAKYEFSPSPEDKNMLPLAVGEQVTIIDKMHGWQSRLVEGL
jgi:hypothetical protein